MQGSSSFSDNQLWPVLGHLGSLHSRKTGFEKVVALGSGGQGSRVTGGDLPAPPCAFSQSCWDPSQLGVISLPFPMKWPFKISPEADSGFWEESWQIPADHVLQEAPGKPWSQWLPPWNRVQDPLRGFLAFRGSSHGSAQSSWSPVLLTTVSFFSTVVSCPQQRWFSGSLSVCFILSCWLSSHQSFSAPCCFWLAASDLWVWPPKQSWCHYGTGWSWALSRMLRAAVRT